MSGNTDTERVALGGGCHWCTEAVFQSLAGVLDVRQGFVASDSPDDSFSEAVIVEFDPSRISLTILVEVHLRTHASTSDHVLRSRYRSAVYTFSEAQHVAAGRALQEVANETGAAYVTEVLPFAEFRESEARYRDYYRSGPERPFCKRYIDPKLEFLRAEYSRWAA